MSWLTPLTGAILLASVIPPLLLLYFLKLRRKAMSTSSTLLWQTSVEDVRANAPFQRLRPSILLFLQLLALALLGLAVMQPRIEGGNLFGGRTVFLIDNSASMSALDGEDGASRLDEAKKRARDRIELMYGGGLLSKDAGETMIVTFAGGGEIASRFTRSKTALLAAIDRIEPTDGTTELAEALKLARAYTTNVDPDSDRPIGDPPSLELFSDGIIDDLSEHVLRGERLVYHRIGTLDADNAGVVAIAVERAYDRPAFVEVFAAMANYGPAEMLGDVQLSVGGIPVAVQEMTLPAARRDDTGTFIPGRGSIVFAPFEEARGTVIEVRLLRDDILAVDNVARVVVPPPKQLVVGLVNSSDFILRSVMEGLDLRRLELMDGTEFERLAGDNDLGQFDVIVFDDYAPPAEALLPARYLSFGKPPPDPGFTAFGESRLQRVLHADNDHPTLRFVDLDQVIVSGASLIQPADDVRVLVEGNGGPLLMEKSDGAMTMLYATFAVRNSNLPLLRGWVTFMFNAIDYLGHLDRGVTRTAPAVGEVISAVLPPGSRNVSLLLPDGEERSLPSSADPGKPVATAWGPIRRSGLYELKWTEPGEDEPSSRQYAVNSIDEHEGAVNAREDVVFGEERVESASRAASAYTPLWPYAIVLCLVVLMIEWWTYFKKL